MIRSLIALCLISTVQGFQGNPVLDGADPHALIIDGEYWVFPTEPRAREPIFAAYHSSDLKTWKREGPLLELKNIPWIKEDGAPRHSAWAPAMLEKNGRFYFYYSVGPQNPTPSRIGVAVGSSITGPFTDSGKPLLTGGNGFEAIDPMVFTDPTTSKSYFYAGGSAGAKLRVFEMADDMVSFQREVPVEQPKNFTEGAFMHKRGKIYYLSYSHGRWNDSTYSVHYATAPSPTGPWEYRGAILESDAKRQGPGHHAFVEHPGSKQTLIVYHRWETESKQSPYKGGRKIAFDKVEYDATGLIRPIVMTP